MITLNEVNEVKTTAKQPLAYSYVRFSKGSQKLGDSLRRQLQDTRSFCKTHGLHLVEEMQALGVSAFKGKNLDDTSILGEFLQRIKEGKIEKGSVLVCESFDRISRDKVTRANQVLLDIICNGVGIAPLSFNGQILTEASVNENPMLLVMAIIEQMRGGNESSTKSNRINKRLADKYAQVEAGKHIYFGGFMPSYIKGMDAQGEWVIDTKRVAIVKRMFKEFLLGTSLNQIAVGLNTDCKKGLIVSGLKRKHDNEHKPKGWHPATIRCVLVNPAVTGTFKLKGKEYAGYLPAIISQKDFDVVQLKLKQNTLRRGGNFSGEVNSIFRGVCKCNICGGSVGVISANYEPNGKRYSYFGCVNARQGNCKAKTRISMAKVEQVFFEHCMGYGPSDFLGQDAQVHIKELESLKASLDAVNKKIAATVALMDSGIELAEVRQRLTTLQLQKGELTDAQKALAAKTNANAIIPDQAREFVDAMKEDLSNKEVRAKLVNILPTIVKQITFYLDCTKGQHPDFLVELTNGETWSYIGSIEEEYYRYNKKGQLVPYETVRSMTKFTLGK